MAAKATGLTVMQLLLRVEGKLDGFILAHEGRHTLEATADLQARTDAGGSAAGRALSRAISDVATDVTVLAATVASHDRTIQRLTGAFALLTTLGIGTLLLMFFRVIGLGP